MASLAVIAAAFLLLAATASSSPAVHIVGDEKGWAVPGNGTESYNHWAKRNRFQVGDILEFKYVNDSVVVVNHDGYKQCSTASPVSRFADGDTKFPFDRYGLFYFISGVQGHCEDGQRMIVRVMAESALAGAPSSAPAPGPATPSTSPVIGEPSPAVTAPGTPLSSPSTSTPSPSPGPTQASGASGRAITGFFSIAAAVLVVCVVTVFVLV